MKSGRWRFQLGSLYGLNFNQLKQNWNFNRFLVLLSYRLRIVDRDMTAHFGQSRPFNAWSISSRIYRPLFSRRSEWGQEFVPDVLVVAQHGRFGNMVRQVVLAVASAEKLQIREVLVKSMPEFPQGTFVLDNGVALTHDSRLRARMIARPRLALGGDFFVRPRLPVNVEDVDFDKIGAGLLEAARLPIEQPMSSSTLVIHFRSGDAFSEKPHAELGQPPLSFYQKVIDAEQPQEVVLVFEDYGNPVIERVESYLWKEEIPFRVQSGDFREDLAAILSARVLVTSQGSFAEAVLLLSQNLERWISFSSNPSLHFRRRSITATVSVFDPEEDYSSEILQGKWTNSAEQRRLMLEFEAEKLELREWANNPRN